MALYKSFILQRTLLLTYPDPDPEIYLLFTRRLSGMGEKNGLYAFVYNSTESEPI